MESKALGLFVAAGTAVTLMVVLRRLRDKLKFGDGKDKERLGHSGGVWRGSGDEVWVSERAKGLLGGGGPAYIMEHIARLGDTYDEVTAPVSMQTCFKAEHPQGIDVPRQGSCVQLHHDLIEGAQTLSLP